MLLKINVLKLKFVLFIQNVVTILSSIQGRHDFAHCWRGDERFRRLRCFCDARFHGRRSKCNCGESCWFWYYKSIIRYFNSQLKQRSFHGTAFGLSLLKLVLWLQHTTVTVFSFEWLRWHIAMDRYPSACSVRRLSCANIFRRTTEPNLTEFGIITSVAIE